MKLHNSRLAGRGVKTKAAAIVAGSLALALGTTVAASADGGAASISKADSATKHVATSAFSSQSPNTAQEDVWAFSIDGRDANGTIWSYGPKAGGGFNTREQTGTNMGSANAFFKNNSANDGHVNVYARFGGTLRAYTGAQSTGTVIGNGWNVYSAFVTPGNLGGAEYPDLLARDTSGNLWVYLAYKGGTFASRVKVGGGWNAYNQIAGRGDLTGDGKADIVARDGSGNLWLYKGTGNYKAPFAARTKIGAGWNAYNRLVGLGDSNGDGRNDLIARATNGDLYLYAGTGNASAPYKPRVKIGNGWNVYNYLF
ncbi:VCBS repeat-containing protein [Streptomyces sp. NPDC051976]|uniref:FG-GAP repeat domain-containing protein n=1 Tax=Streptomyces sp. NPDC051976 TaxID=3154947 RepID=UPI0034304B40